MTMLKLRKDMLHNFKTSYTPSMLCSLKGQNILRAIIIHFYGCFNANRKEDLKLQAEDFELREMLSVVQ